MRFSVCLRLTRSFGFFWGTLLMPYASSIVGWRGSFGYRSFWRKFVFSLAEGGFIRTQKISSVAPSAKVRSLARILFFYAPPHIPLRYPWAWFILRQLKLRTYRGSRYRLGLPANGQRTHTNASSVSSHNDTTVSLLREVYWRKRLWQMRANPSMVKSKQGKHIKSKHKAIKKKGPAVRSKDKKKSVWR